YRCGRIIPVPAVPQKRGPSDLARRWQDACGFLLITVVNSRDLSSATGGAVGTELMRGQLNIQVVFYMSESFAELFEASLANTEMRPGTIIDGTVVDIRS